MARNTSFALGEHFQRFIEQRVAEGRYGSASEVVRAGLRLLEDYEAQVARLGEAILEGERSGPAERMDFGKFAAELRSEYDK
jgi:antitoxin ParD1/3/4